MNDERFEQLLGEIRQEQASPGDTEAVRDRVWQKLAGGPSQVCAGFRAEFADYLAGGLTEGRGLLVDDHLSRCAECRRTVAELRGEASGRITVLTPARPPRARLRTRPATWTRWAVAAGIAVAALYAGSDRLDRLLAPSGPRATVEAASGDVFRLPQIALQNGAALNDGDVIRTGAGARAVLRLADGSRVELNQRTELFVEAAWSGETIRLNRGDVIVEAAKQRRGHLRVVTSDSTAAVKGTVFAVSTDTVGSVVSVVEGSVAVEQPGAKRLLTAGQNSSTNPSLNRVGVRQSIDWSSDRGKYTTLLGEFAGIEKVLTSAPEASRTEAKLLRYLPAGTLFYFAFPNLNGTLRQAVAQFEQRARENAVLGEWWNSEQGLTLKQTLDRIQAVTPYLGDEVLFLLVNSANQKHAAFPLLLAQVQPDRQDALRQGLERIAGATEGGIPYRISDDLLLISESKSSLDTVPSVLGTGAGSAFAKEIQARYQTGAGWLAAIDVAAMGLNQDASRFLGAGNMRHLFFEQHSANGNSGSDTEATLSFEGVRTGLASWLASPGSTGSTEYVSPEAIAAFSASTRDPRQAIEEVFSALGQDQLAHLRAFESETGVSLTADIAGALGTDFTLAIERPTLPVPGWIAAFEVTRPGVLDDSVRRLVEAFNRHQTESASAAVTLKQETVNGRVWTSLQGPVAAATLYWTYDRGYLVASTDRALAARAISIREAGSSLAHSAAFQQSVPSSGSLHHSAYIWINTNGALADMAGLIQSPALKSLAESRTPILIALDGETERIHASSRTRLTSLVLDLMLVRSTVGAEPGPQKRAKQLKAIDR